MVTLWFVLLGVLFAGYFALAGADYGTALLLRSAGPDRRREVLAATGPFFLGNEVWLVAAVGVMFGAFPRLEGELLSALYPVVVAILVALVAFTAAVQLRGRRAEGTKAGWDVVIVGGAGVVALGWGAFLGALLEGIPLDASGHRVGGLVSPVVVLCALAFGVLVVAHGAVFLGWRSTVDVRRLVGPLTTAAAGLVGLVAVSSVLFVDGVEPLVAVPGAVAVAGLVLVGGRMAGPAAKVPVCARVGVGGKAVLGGTITGGGSMAGGGTTAAGSTTAGDSVAADGGVIAGGGATAAGGAMAGGGATTAGGPMAGGGATAGGGAMAGGGTPTASGPMTGGGGRRARPAVATVCTGLACGLPVLVIGAARWPVALASTGDPAGTLTVVEAAAGPATLSVLVWFAVLVLPLVAAFQGMCWWAYRDRRPVFW